MSCARAGRRSLTVSYPAESFEERVENAEHGRCCEDEASDSELLKLGRVDFHFILDTRPDSKCRVTANTNTQLDTATWADIRKWGALKLTASRWAINLGDHTGVTPTAAEQNDTRQMAHTGRSALQHAQGVPGMI